MAGDHSFKVIKHVRLGRTLYSAAWSVKNEHNQILGVWFVRDKGLKEVQHLHELLQRRWERAGQVGPALFYTGNAPTDEKYLTRVHPSLCRSSSVTFPDTDTYSLQLPPVVEYWKLGECRLGELAMVCARLAKEKLLGFDAEWNRTASSHRPRPGWQPGAGGGKIATLQVASSQEVHIFHTAFVEQVHC